MALKLFFGFYQAIVTPVNIPSLLIRNHLCYGRFVALHNSYGGMQGIGATAQKRTKVSFQRLQNTLSGDPGCAPSIMAVRSES